MVSLLVVFAVLLLGFARLASVLGFDEPVIAPPGPPETTLPSPGAASVTATLPPVPATGIPAAGLDPSTPSSVPPSPGASSSSTLPADPVSAKLPPRWPLSLPDPGEHVVLGIESEQEDRWLLAVPGNAPLAGGRFLAALEELEWDVSTISTPRTVTAVGTRDQERVAVSMRPGGELAPDGWLLLEVVYQPTIPDFEVPPSSTVPPEQEATKRS